MSYIQKNMKFLKEKQKNLEFFESYLDISKLRILQILNDEQKALDVLKMVKYSNSKLLESINVNFFKNEKTFIETSDSEPRSKKELYFLVDAKEDDEYAEVMYKKLEETLEAKIKNGDSVITVGRRVNLIAQKLELNIIQHFSYEIYEEQNEFINKLATIIEVGFKNKIFTDATLIVAQQNQDNREMVMKKLAPFENDKNENDIFAEQESNSNKTKTTDFENMKQNSNLDYSKFFSNLNVKKLSWIPNITFFKFKLIKAIIKQNVVEIKLIEKIQRLKLEIHLIDEKRNKIHDESIVVQRLLNRVRREKNSESILNTYTAFKVRKQQNGDNTFDDVIRKKRDLDDILYKPRKFNKGGVR